MLLGQSMGRLFGRLPPLRGYRANIAGTVPERARHNICEAYAEIGDGLEAHERLGHREGK